MFKLIRTVAVAYVVALALGAVSRTLADTLPGPGAAPVVEIERMTWLEVRDRVAHGSTTIIIPTGGTEQNGPHMAIGKHNFVVAATARQIAETLGDALVAPVQPYVPEGDPAKRQGNMAFPGTVSLPDPVFEGVLKAAADSFREHGFKTIVFLGDHGQSIGPQGKVAQELSRAWAGQGVRVINAVRYYAQSGGDLWLMRQAETEATIGDHAGIRDTSELMAVSPASVDLAKAGANRDGASGDARRASAERGQALIALKVKAAVEEIKAARAAPLPAPTLAGWLGGFLWR